MCIRDSLSTGKERTNQRLSDSFLGQCYQRLPLKLSPLHHATRTTAHTVLIGRQHVNPHRYYLRRSLRKNPFEPQQKLFFKLRHRVIM